ncbi:terminase small subunit [Amycolatopsis jiangsuensis]|uniref:Terminase small subunit actinomycetes phage-type domain-containing protein n=1 Tax=Amycolatopsis jiangsuensis TaxID=1181879 RepID=A0A840J3Z9_9PSEU|nr:hypothetical protein [Amycolatopsis jiangsuensis]MBB4689816.1 hypothetical protein [Amycolatopsis jiangsuensis]
MSPAKRLPLPSDVLGATRTALRELEVDDEDRAAVALAIRLASAIDNEDRSGHVLAELAGKLLAVLVELGATPAARKAVLPKGGPVERTPQQRAKDELKERRAARAGAP